MVQVTATLDDKKLQQSFKRIERQLKNPKKLLRRIGNNEMDTLNQRIVQRKLSPDNQIWAPWSYATLRQRQKEGNVGLGLLYRTGNLLKSFFLVIKKQSIAIQNTALYAKYLQFGTHKMPARPFMGWGKDSIKDAKKEVKETIRKEWK